eukprot:TRINITY_DN1318_c0_g1_i4.p1 TRINITY_DN1318_c0_g1~~TRINITY_DN1318_c0_g1_i4.p1  ORF type:complete len:461 (+),score=91.29 TRINITY_DN1318_c0_g1_i4:305-1687(+)
MDISLTNFINRPEDNIHTPWVTVIFTYIQFIILLSFGHTRRFLSDIFRSGKGKTPDGYAPLVDDFTEFYTKYMYHRASDLWNRPICSVPGRHVRVMERVGNSFIEPLRTTGDSNLCLNLASYNYLGFAENFGQCNDSCHEALDDFGASTCSTRAEFGNTVVHRELEETIARFVGKEDAVIFSTGYGTNSMNIPAIVGKGGLILSDSLNHASLVSGCRLAGARVKVFNHDASSEELEEVIRRAIADGQPRTHRPWTKILIMAEGIYSMEGDICPLPELVRIKNKYKCYLYVDEAHSIGALGPTGRGVCDLWGVSPDDVDILMGTFTKSFGGCGGYIAASKALVDTLRATSLGWSYQTSMAVPVCRQVITALTIIMGEDGTDEGAKRLKALADNAKYFRRRIKELGFHCLGDEGSPVLPILVYHPAKMPHFSRELLENNIAVAVVGFPATPLLLCRDRKSVV